jgi:5,10-methylenetetrahydrofolate reductase
MPAHDLLRALTDPTRPTFTFGLTPPREGTSEADAKRIVSLFAARSAALATDGYIVYSLVDESVRTALPRPFPFRATMDASLFASYFWAAAGKRAVVYKPVSEATPEAFDAWLATAVERHAHATFTLVGAPSASAAASGGLTLLGALERARERPGIASGCVAIAERHTAKGNEHENMLRKGEAGASWFITQGIFDAASVVRLLNDYGALCAQRKVAPRKVILTFAPVGRRKTLEFIKWLGMAVPPAIEERIFAAASPVLESTAVLCEVLQAILAGSAGSGVPLGLNVESVSIVKEEIDAAHALFQLLQVAMLNARGSPWAVRWYAASDALAEAEGDASRALAVLRKEVRELAVEAREGARAGALALGAGLALSSAALAALAFLLGRAYRR